MCSSNTLWKCHCGNYSSIPILTIAYCSVSESWWGSSTSLHIWVFSRFNTLTLTQLLGVNEPFSRFRWLGAVKTLTVAGQWASRPLDSETLLFCKIAFCSTFSVKCFGSDSVLLFMSVLWYRVAMNSEIQTGNLNFLYTGFFIINE